MSVDPRRTLPTKINLIRLKRDYAMIKRVRKVMDEKREVLLHYIRSTAEDYNKYQNEVFKNTVDLFTTYYRGLVNEGIAKVNLYSSSVPESFVLKTGMRVLYSVRTPTFTPKMETLAIPSLPPGSSPDLTMSYIMLKNLLPSILNLAMYEETILRLIDELKETQRLINALDYVILPSYIKTIKYIASVLDERMREDFVRLKILKRKRVLLEEKSKVVMEQQYR
ncbi:MAG: V-type ATP synthase subunit D [Caldisphaera sp.]